jgi:predicted transcriptional regulator of viral defense system
MSLAKAEPDWDRLYEVAAAQDGHFTASQARKAGYYRQRLAKHLTSGRIRRVRRAIYRMVHFPAGEHEDLTVLWLWSAKAGVFSHETALGLHELSDALPSRAHLTLPLDWRRRRLRLPRGLILHHADLAATERGWVGPIPVTSPERTLRDCAAAAVEPRLVRDAFEQAADRGLIRRDAVPEVIGYLERFYSVSGSRSSPRFRSTTRPARSRRP